MKFEEWWSENANLAMADVEKYEANIVWSACLKHARTEFLEREISKLIKQMENSIRAMDAYATIKLEMQNSIDPAKSVVGFALATLEYLKEQAEKEKE